MSQSDYIFLKRVGRELSDIKHNLPPVLTSRNYTDYKLYTLAYNITNTKTVYWEEIPSDTQLVFDMERPLNTDCSGFALCINTDKRPNRVLVDPSCGFFPMGVYPKNQDQILYQISQPGYMNHLKSVNYINANLCDGCGNFVCNNNPVTKKFLMSEVFLPKTTPTYPRSMQTQTVYPNKIQKYASYAGYNNRRVAENYAQLLQAPNPVVPFTLIPPFFTGATQSYLFN